MSFKTLDEVISILIVAVVAITYVYFGLKSAKNILQKIAIVIIAFLLSIFIFYFSPLLFNSFLANSMPMDKTVPCYLLNKQNCDKRVECYTTIPPAGLGGNIYECMRKP